MAYDTTKLVKLAALKATSERVKQFSAKIASAAAEAIEELAGTIPKKLSDLTADTTHRTVTDTEKTKWNGAMPKSGGTFTGNIIAGASNQSPSTALLRNSKRIRNILYAKTPV